MFFGCLNAKRLGIIGVAAVIVIVTVVLCVVLIPQSKKNNVTPPTPQQFPTTFKFGSASSAYQIEGAYNVDGKGENVWDVMTRDYPERILDGSNGNDAANSYEFYEEDVKALVEAKMQFYRFSISWSRILPTGDISSANELGLQYYDNLINALIKNKIEPMITMYHWDMPEKLQQLGGMPNPIIVDYFEQYAKLLFERYADRVKLWNTFNEPIIFCEYGHGNLVHAPLVNSPGIGDYLCGHHVLLANARVYRMYHNFYNADKTGKIGIVLNSPYTWPLDASNEADVAAADQSMQFWLGWFAHPIFSSTGGYPPVMTNVVNNNSIAESRTWSRLPEFTADEIVYVKGTSDFLGLNYYTSHYATPATDASTRWPNPSYYKDVNSILSQNQTWPVAKSSWLRSAPDGLRALLNWIKNQYSNPEVFITENGWSDSGELEDEGRIEYLRGHLQAVLDAVLRDRCNVVGHTTWSIIDNFEWTAGYTERFGLFHIDFTSPNKTRTAKSSVAFLRSIIQTRMMPTD
ncbi:myrosinase 1-like [Bradysia coprophila]|uniref:myrosinase 1-like n=1 Tax=Bradysia coprophila TaxID=38358 RepID=UPI00187DA8AD|nr:myrosinase 1-like [Bradysia coprophila]